MSDKIELVDGPYAGRELVVNERIQAVPETVRYHSPAAIASRYIDLPACTCKKTTGEYKKTKEGV